MKKLFTILLSFVALGAYAQSTDYYPSNGVVYYGEVIANWGNFFFDANSNYGNTLGEGSIVSTSQSDAYDGAFEVAIDDSAYVYTVGASDTTTIPNTINVWPQTIKGLKVSKQYYFSGTQPIVRLLLKIENPTGSDQSVRVDIGSNLGSDDVTQMDSCSTGSSNLSNADRWAITSDGSSSVDPLGDPVNTWVRYGLGSPLDSVKFDGTHAPAWNNLTGEVNPIPEAGNDNLVDSIHVTVPANSYVYVMQFNRLDSTVIAAKAYVHTFDDLAAMAADGLFDGISPSDLAKIANWDFGSVPTSVIKPKAIANASNQVGSITLSPNPNNGTVNVSWSTDSNISEIQVVNSLGNIVKTVVVGAISTIQINTSDLPNGVYYLHLNDGSSNGIVKKMVKK